MFNLRFTILTKTLCDLLIPRHLSLLYIIKEGGHKEWLVSKVDNKTKVAEDLLDKPSNILILMPTILLWTLFKNEVGSLYLLLRLLLSCQTKISIDKKAKDIANKS